MDTKTQKQYLRNMTEHMHPVDAIDFFSMQWRMLEALGFEWGAAQAVIDEIGAENWPQSFAEGNRPWYAPFIVGGGV